MVSLIICTIHIFLQPMEKKKAVGINRSGWVVITLAVLAMEFLSSYGSKIWCVGYLYFIFTIAYFIGKNISNDQMQLLRIEQELRTAREIQFSIIPKKVPSIPGLDIAAKYIPMDAIGGDFYDFCPVGTEGVGVLITDVSGHGVPAALIASMIKISFFHEHNNSHLPARLLQGLNHSLRDKLEKRFLTAGFTYINTQQKKLLYARAGHLPLMVWRKKQQECIELTPKGILIGFSQTRGYDVDELTLQAGDRILLYTDGLIETFSKEEEVFGVDNLKKLLEQHQDLSAAAFADRLLIHLRDWTGKDKEESFDDDLTFIVMDVSFEN
ncbi:MAG: serine/threonine-protein phosphatase [bacterium]|nr:serine/threonine-protein phosphatase [bacterium]